VKWNDAKPQVKTETFEVENDSDHHKNISVPCSAFLDFRELWSQGNGNAKNGTGDTASAAAIKR